MNWAEMHLSTEAIAAYVDCELSHGAASRAEKHLRTCLECAAAVNAQMEAKSALLDSAGPALPASLLQRLSAIPFATEPLPGFGPDTRFAAQGSSLLVGAPGGYPPPPAAGPVPSAAPALPRPASSAFFRRG